MMRLAKKQKYQKADNIINPLILVSIGIIPIITVIVVIEQFLHSMKYVRIVMSCFQLICLLFLEIIMVILYRFNKELHRKEKNNTAAEAELKENIKIKEIEFALKENERSKEVYFDNLQGLAYRCKVDRDWTMQYVSSGCFELTGYYPESLINNSQISFNDLIQPTYQNYIWNKWQAVIAEKIKLKEEYQIKTASGQIKWVYEQGQAIYGENDTVIALEGLVIDITERKEQEIKLKYISEHDMHSGIYNRRYFENRMKRENEDNGLSKRAILMLNIRNFRAINIAYGYDGGENLIKGIGEKLNTLTTSNCELFHIAIDRFVFLVKNYHSQTELEELSEKMIKLIKSLHSPHDVQSNIGILELDNYKKDINYILKLVSIAVDEVSKNDETGYCYFTKKMEDKIDRIEIIKREIRNAITDPDAANLYLVYQPIVEVKTNKVYAFEALARLNSNTLGQVSPIEFISIAEETGLIIPLGMKIMRQAFRFLHHITKSGYQDVSISINISVLQLLKEDFIEVLKGLLEQEQVNPFNIKIELTETVFSDHYNKINTVFYELKNMGIKIALDDFGTGHSSLARERELNIDYMKIDKYFIDKLLNDNKEAEITGDIISMAHKLGQYVIAEGVEYEEQKYYLAGHDCDFIQGYLYGRPLLPDGAMNILQKEIAE